MKKSNKKNPENSFEISKEIYIYTIAALFIISIIAGGIHWSRNFGFGPMMMQRQIYNLEGKLNYARLNADDDPQFLNKKKGKEFRVEDVNIDAVNSYFFNNIKNYPPFNLNDAKKIEYVDLNNDGQNEALAVLNTKLSYLADINKSENILKPENAGEETMVNVIGVFLYGSDKTWSPLYLDFVSMPIYNENGDSLPDANEGMQVLSRIEVTDRKYNSSETTGVTTEISVEKKYAKDQKYKYKLIFNNLDLAGKETEK